MGNLMDKYRLSMGQDGDLSNLGRGLINHDDDTDLADTSKFGGADS
jgi:hypothetical protein